MLNSPVRKNGHAGEDPAIPPAGHLPPRSSPQTPYSAVPTTRQMVAGLTPGQHPRNGTRRFHEINMMSCQCISALYEQSSATRFSQPSQYLKIINKTEYIEQHSHRPGAHSQYICFAAPFCCSISLGSVLLCSSPLLTDAGNASAGGKTRLPGNCCRLALGDICRSDLTTREARLRRIDNDNRAGRSLASRNSWR